MDSRTNPSPVFQNNFECLRIEISKKNRNCSANTYSMDIQSEIRNLIANNNLKKAFARAKEWLVILGQADKDQALPVIEMRFKSVKDQELMGFMPYSESLREYMQISKSLMEWVEKMSAQPLEDPPKITAIPTEEENIVVLFLASNPSDTAKMELEKEFARVSRIMQDCNYAVKLVSEWALTTDSLQSAILKHKPRIIHFSGHGLGSTTTQLDSTHPIKSETRGLSLRNEDQGGIILQDANGKSHLVKGQALEQMFAIFSRYFPIDAVILNACYSEEQAKGISKYVKFVIGMNKAIEDQSALEFSNGFYMSMAMQYDIQLSFELAKNKIHLAGLPGHDIPVIFMR